MGWQDLWQDPEVAKLWKDFPPDTAVVEMVDLLESQGRRRVLDIGCGVGRHTVYLAARGFDVTATDNAPAAISACKQNPAEASLGANVVQTDMTDLPFPDDHFDGAVASHVIHHTDAATLERVIELITRKLAPAGLFVWVTPSSRDYRSGHGCCVEPGTYIDDEHPEGLIPHHYCSQEEVRQLLHAYDILSMHEDGSGEAEKRKFHWCVLARKTGHQ
jgi:tellurite methyltransferase